MVVYALALIPVTAVSLVYLAKPCSEIDVGEQGGTFHFRDFHAIAHVDDLSYRSTNERSCLVLPGIDGHALDLLRPRLDAHRPAVDLSASGRELGSSDVSSDAYVPADFLVSVKLSGSLPLFWIFTYLTSRFPIGRRTKPCRSTGYGPKEISV
jgi:hypothetical protein